MTLRIFQRLSPVQVLGPGSRAVVWTQGCPFACKSCIVPESWDARGGQVVDVEEVAQWVLDQPDIEGVTFSGGEPMAQAGALVELSNSILKRRDLGVICYTGYTLEDLQEKGTDEQRALLAKIDLLVDGLYRDSLHANLLWRGSSNQRLLLLSDRYLPLLGTLTEGQDSCAGLEFHMDEDGSPTIIGVPPIPQFRQTMENSLKTRGVVLNPGEEEEPR